MEEEQTQDEGAGSIVLSEEAAPAKQRRGKGKLLWIAVAAVLIVGAIVGIFAVQLTENPEKLLADGWSNTYRILSERYSGGPLSAMGEALAKDAPSTKLSLALSDVVWSEMEIPGTLELALHADSEKNVALTADTTFLDIPLDAQFYCNSDFLGLGSRALVGDSTVYGATPGHFAEEAKDGAFVSDSDMESMDVLKRLDDIFNGVDNSQGAALEDIDTTMAELTAQYKAFVQSVKPEKSKGAVPTTEAAATVLTYVYPANKAIDTLESMMNTYLSSEWAETYYESIYGAASYTGGLSLKEMRGVWAEVLADLRKNYTGDITVRYYLVNKTVAYLEISGEPTYAGEKAKLDGYVDFGLEGDTLTAEVSLGDATDTYGLRLTSQRTLSDTKAASDWKVEGLQNGSAMHPITSGHSQWDKASGALRFSMAGNFYAGGILDGSGTLAVDDAGGFKLALGSVRVIDGSETVASVGVALTLERGIAVPQPENTQNILKSTEDELYGLLETVSDNLMGSAPEEIGPTQPSGVGGNPAFDWTVQEFTLDGKALSIPFAYRELEDMGWRVDFSGYGNMDDEYILNPGDKVSGTIDLFHDKYDDLTCWVGFQNNSSTARNITECDVWSFLLEHDDDEDWRQENAPAIVIAGGLTWGSTVDQVKAVLGEPDDIYSSSDVFGYHSLTYASDDYNKYLELTVYNDSGLASIQLQNYG